MAVKPCDELFDYDQLPNSGVPFPPSGNSLEASFRHTRLRRRFMYEPIIPDFIRSVNKDTAFIFMFLSEKVRKFENSFTNHGISRYNEVVL
jgi:hypothetical protein